MSTAESVIREMEGMFDEKQSSQLSRFFKTGKGEYGEGDKFLGIKVPFTRSIVKKYQFEITLEDIKELINSKWHEIRLSGFLLLLELYKKDIKVKDFKQAGQLVTFYLSNIPKGNNWDFVDLISPYLLGDWISRNPQEEKILFNLAAKEGSLWHQRVAIVSTFSLIKIGKFDLTIQIATKFINHPHDLIHKATGWMLREIGKRGGKRELIRFLEENKCNMPRTMLRYAIEKFPEEERKYFMKK